MKIKINSSIKVLPYLIVTIIVFISLNNGFFWDTIQLASEHPSFYYSNNFSSLLLPTGIDSGHIPTFGIYLAIIWKIFGKSLIVSHLSILPFALGIVYQFEKTAKKFVDKKYVIILVLLFILDSTILSQISLVSPDIPLTFFFLFTLNSVLENKKKLISIGVILLFLTSMRGMMIGFCFFLYEAIISFKSVENVKYNIKTWFKVSLKYLPALLIFIVYNSYHYYYKGWIGFHKDSPWKDCFERVDLMGFLRNLIIYGWRIIDFGRIGVVVLLIFALIKQKNKLNLKQRKLFLLLLIFTFIFPINMIWAKNLLAHRYLIPIYLLISLFTASILFNRNNINKLSKYLALFWFVLIISGYFWVYPKPLTQGWDSTIAHLPYYKLRNQAIEYIEKEKINFDDVKTFFPNYYPINEIDLNNDKRSFGNFISTERPKYIFYSTVYNVDDEDYYFIQNEYFVKKTFKNFMIEVSILERKK